MNKICVVCEKKFRARRKDIKCCSITCSKFNRTIKTTSKRCSVCKKTFYRKPGTAIHIWERQKSCSLLCRLKRIKAHRIGFKIGHVGYKNSGNFKKGTVPWNKGLKGVIIPPSRKGCRPWNKGKPMSEKTIEKLRIARAKQDMSFLRGANHHNWKGGVTPIMKQIRTLYEYTRWRSSVFERDDWTCQDCKKRGGTLNAHHIKPFSRIITDNNVTTVEEAKLCSELWDISNGITLCNTCHFKTDTYGEKVKL
jgi:hypothetical protein